MKKLVVSLFVSTLMSSAIAADMGQWNHWSIGADAIWLKPSGVGISDAYGAIALQPNADTSRTTYQDINPNYQSGYIINLGYQPCPCNDFKLSYLRLHTSKTNSYGPTSDLDESLLSGSGKLTIDLDQIDLTAGRMVNFNPIVSAHFFGGLRYSTLSNKITGNTSNISLVNPDDNLFTSTYNNSSYWGIGPLGGMEGTWWLFNNFGLTGLLDGALLVGKPYFNSVFSETDSEGTTDINGFTSNTKHKVVAVFTAKLGGVYSKQIKSNIGLKVETGYQVLHYANVFTNLLIGNGIDQNFDGPYFGATLNFG